MILVPLLAAHAFEMASPFAALTAVVCFCVLASGTYLVNDLLDIQDDLQHLLLIVVSVFPLYVLGIDFYRWNAMLLTLAFIYISYAGRVADIRYQTPVWLIIACFVFALWSGPFGISLALPERGFLFSALGV